MKRLVATNENILKIKKSNRKKLKKSRTMVGTINAFNIKPIANKTDKQGSISIASDIGEQKNDKSMTFKVKK
mgnify:CR=1 FL=1